ncbi:hypothetical protein GGR56DRAFT_582049 [Xylariaceae sp. FL0804]|nr:hypothetical protein GGR56DRAFT_582049 [Xylariaceae sp. FL0804]
MQRTTPSATPTTENNVPFFHINIWGNGAKDKDKDKEKDSASKSRPGTSAGDPERLNSLTTQHSRNRPSFSRKSSFTSPSKSKRRASSGTSNGYEAKIVTDAAAPPKLPDYALAAAARLASRAESESESPLGGADPFSKMNTSNPAGFYGASAGSPPVVQQLPLPPTETPSLFQHVQDIVNKRISTLDYLRKAHEGRVYWFNTLLFDKPDLARMPYFNSAKLVRRANNYLLLGLSLPAVIDLNSSTPMEFLRSLNTLLTEFDSYQQIHTVDGVSASSLTRARLPHMFRRGPVGKGRRASSAAGMDTSSLTGGGTDGGIGGIGGGSGGLGGGGRDGSAVNAAPASVISFGLGGEGGELLPGEEYTHLLTPNLPFDPDFFETFATLCDVLIDCYSRLMSLLPGPRECTPAVVELFTKADSRVRKIIIQGVVKEFEDSSRSGLKQEVSNVGKVVLGGLV